MSDNDNPFRAPESDFAPVQPVQGVLSGNREDLRRVAKYQRAIMFCILAYLAAVPLQFIVPQELLPFVGIGAGLVVITGMVFVFLLSTKVYGVALGIVLGLFSLIPCLGLLILLMVNSKATNVLKSNGIKVGFLGADPSVI